MKYEDIDDVHDFVMEKYEACESFYSAIFQEGEEDNEFLYGINQWTPSEVKSRDTAGNPSLVYNQLLPYAKQVINDIRQTRPSIRITPADGNADEETAEIFAGLIRNIERQSNANTAYDTAAMNSVGSGLGWIRVCLDYASPMSFDQEISIERVLNFQSAMIAPCNNLDGSDTDFGCVIDTYSKQEFESKWPDADVSSFTSFSEGWVGDDSVRVADCYYKVYEEREIVLAKYERDGVEVEGVLTREEVRALSEEGFEVEELETRKTDFAKIKQCTISGKEVLSETDWVGNYIPIIPVVGEESFIDGRQYFQSLIHQAKDAQKGYNFWKSESLIYIKNQNKTPFIAPVGSFDTYGDEWEKANIENIPYLEYDIVYDKNGQRVEPPREKSPIQGSPIMLQEAAGARQDIRLALGMPEASMGEDGRDISGIALKNRQIRGDNATFHFLDNLATAITQVGVVLVDLMPKVYNKPQIRRILGEDKKESLVPINQPFIKEGNKKRPAKPHETKYDGFYRLDAGKYDVVCDIGASYSSQRQEMADKLSELMAIRPELIEISGDLLFDALDLPMSQEFSKRIKSTMNPALFEDDPQAAKLKEASMQMQQMQEQLANMDAALKDKEKNNQFEQDYKMAELELDRQKALVDAEKTQAEIAKIQAEISGGAISALESVNNVSNVVAQLAEQVEDITQAFGVLLDHEEEKAMGEPIELPDNASVEIRANE